MRFSTTPSKKRSFQTSRLNLLRPRVVPLEEIAQGQRTDEGKFLNYVSSCIWVRHGRIRPDSDHVPDGKWLSPRCEIFPRKDSMCHSEPAFCTLLVHVPRDATVAQSRVEKDLGWNLLSTEEKYSLWRAFCLWDVPCSLEPFTLRVQVNGERCSYQASLASRQSAMQMAIYWWLKKLKPKNSHIHLSCCQRTQSELYTF